MSTQKLARELGLSSRQVYYLISQGVIDPAPVINGQKRTFTEHEKWILQMAAAMRKAGIGISAIKAAALTHRSLPPEESSLVIRGGMYPGDVFWTLYWNGKTWRATKSFAEALEYFKEEGYPAPFQDEP